MAADNFARILGLKAVGGLSEVDRIIEELKELMGDIESYDLDTLFGRVNTNTDNIEIINGDETVENSTYWKIANTDFIVKAEKNAVTGAWTFTNNDGTTTTMNMDSEPTADSLNAVTSNGLYVTLKEHEVQVSVLPTPTSTNVGRIYQYTGATTADYINGKFYQNVYDSDSGTYSWVEKEIADPLELSDDIFNSLVYREGKLYSFSIQSDTLPIANLGMVGTIVQYTGLTTANLINGYFYKCVAETESGLTTYSWKPVEVQNSTHISANDFNALIELADGLYVPAVQLSTMPTPTVDYQGKVIQYTGVTTTDYVQGDFYICKYNATDGATWEKLTYNKEEVDELIALANHFIVVEDLPVTDIKTNAIYLVPKTMPITGYYYSDRDYKTILIIDDIDNPSSMLVYGTDEGATIYKYRYEVTDPSMIQSTIDMHIKTDVEAEKYPLVTGTAYDEREARNIKTEYINLDGTVTGWEKIGDTELDLSGYIKYEDLTEITLAEINAMWANAEGV